MLTYLDLFGAKVTDKGCEHLRCSLVSSEPFLQVLSLSWLHMPCVHHAADPGPRMQTAGAMLSTD